MDSSFSNKIAAVTMIVLMASLCSCRCHCNISETLTSKEQDSTSTVIRERIVEIHDTTEIHIPFEEVRHEGGDSSHLETEFSSSDAWIDSVGKLHHELKNKEQDISVPFLASVIVADTNRYENHVSNTESSIQDTVYCELPLSRWHKFQQRGFWVVSIAALVFFAWNSRKFWIRLFTMKK